MFGDTFEGVRSDGRAAGDEESLQQSTGVQVYRCTGVQVYRCTVPEVVPLAVSAGVEVGSQPGNKALRIIFALGI